VFAPPQDVAEAVGAVYRRVVRDSPLNFQARPEQAGRNAILFTSKAADGMREAGGFGDPEQWRYDWERSYTRDEWLDQLASSGALTQLPPDKLAEVLEGAGAALATMGGRFTVSMITVAIMAARAGTA